MDLSVIIVCYKGWNRLTKCLEALDSFTLRSFSMEVIVVDNYSDDPVINDFESKFSKFRFIRNSINGGYAYGCNCGAAEAKGNFLMILNPDTVVREKEIEKLLENAKSNPEYYIISCRQVRDNGKESPATGNFPGNFFQSLIKNKSSDAITFPDWVSGSMMMIRREVYNKLNGFDEEFWMYYEDVDLCLRARDIGGNIAFYGDIVIEHNHGGSSRTDLKTTAVTKCEVQASRHLYIHKHFFGLKRMLLHALVLSDNLIIGAIAGIAGLIFFFIPKLFVRVLIFIGLIKYYSGSVLRKSWISPRSVIYTKPPYK